VGGAVLALLSLLAMSVPALAVPSKPAIVRFQSNLQWLLRNALTGGPADLSFNYGNTASGDSPLFGDWNGDATKTPGVRRANLFLLRNTNSGGAAQIGFGYGTAADIGIAGDWDGDGTDTVGVIRFRADGGLQWLLRNSNTSGGADITLNYGRGETDFPVVGDWDGDGTDTVGVVRLRGDGALQWLLRNSNTSGGANITLNYGRGETDFPVVGDWDGDGTDTVGVVRLRGDGALQWLLRNTNTSGAANLSAVYGAAPDFPVAGDWDDDGTDTVGVVRGRRWLLRNSNTPGAATLGFTYGAGTDNEFPLIWR
jgi:hypothetical protein